MYFCSTIFQKAHSRWQHKFIRVSSKSATAFRVKMAVPATEHLPSSQFLMHSHKMTSSELNKKICVCIPGTECSPLDRKSLWHSKCISFLKTSKVFLNLTSQALSWFTNLEFTMIRDFNRTYKTFQCKNLLLET